MCDLEPGMLVECIDDQGLALTEGDIPLLKRGHIYTIRQVEIFFGVPAVTLFEVPNTCVCEDGRKREGFFLARRFRPLGPERLELFRRALKTVPPVKSVQRKARKVVGES